MGTVATGQQFRQNISFLDDSAATQWDVDVDYGDGSTAQYDCNQQILLAESFLCDRREPIKPRSSSPITMIRSTRSKPPLPLTVLPTVSIDDVVVNEGSQAVFTITLSSAGTQRVSMVVTSANGTAISGSDYDATNSLVSIAAGQTTATFVVSTTDDSTAEGDETFSVLISSPDQRRCREPRGHGHHRRSQRRRPAHLLQQLLVRRQQFRDQRQRRCGHRHRQRGLLAHGRPDRHLGQLHPPTATASMGLSSMSPT